MKYHALFDIVKKQNNLKLSSASNYIGWRFRAKYKTSQHRMHYLLFLKKRHSIKLSSAANYNP